MRYCDDLSLGGFCQGKSLGLSTCLDRWIVLYIWCVHDSHVDDRGAMNISNRWFKHWVQAEAKAKAE